MIPDRVPDVTFHLRVRNKNIFGPNPFEWKDVTTKELFAGQKIVLFAVPGAFTPNCSDKHLPGYEECSDAFIKLGVNRIFCLAVNDAFVMFQWALMRNVEKVVMLPDGNADFTRRMGMLVNRSSHGMGERSWRYSMYVNDGVIDQIFSEPGFCDNPASVGVSVSDAGTMLSYLRKHLG